MKKISVNTVKSFMKENKPEYTFDVVFDVGDSSFEVQVDTYMTTVDRSTFVNRVLSGCFDASDNYRPEYVTPMINATLLQMCTNAPVISIKGVVGVDGESLMDIDAMNDLYFAMRDKFCSNIWFVRLVEEMTDMCEEAIEWRKARILSGGAEAFKQAADSVRGLVDTIAHQVEDADTKSLMEYAGKLTDATKDLGEGGLLKGILSLSGISKA